MSSKRIYNMVLKATDVCPEGELLTDKELERMKLNNVKRDWPETSKVKVYGEDVYFNFGVRFAAVIQEVIQENNGKQTDADSYAALMCRVKQRRYIVLEQVTEWDGTPQENA